MKNRIRPPITMLLVLALVLVALARPVRATNSSTEEFIRFLEDAWVNAIVQKDFNVLHHVVADDFAGISPNGYPYSKAEAISDLQSGSYVVQRMVLDHVKVRVFDDIAIVTCYQNETSRFGDQNSSGRYAFTDVWVKRNGTWQAVSSEGTPVVLP